MNASYIKLKVKLFLLTTILYAVVGILGEIILKHLLPKGYFDIYPIVSVFFWIMGLILVYSIDRQKDANPTKSLNIFMLIKIIRFFAVVLLLVLYVSFRPEIKKPFSISVICNYFIYSILEIYIYYIYNKKMNLNGDKDNHAVEE